MLDIVAIVVLLPVAPAAVDGYEFLPDTTRLVEMFRPEGKYGSHVRGWLDDAGNFVPPGDVGKPSPGPARSLWVKAGPNGEGPPATSIIRLHQEAAYEYRSGVLIKGQFDDAWKFIPDIGGAVIDFREYQRDYREGVTPTVWNLPGKLYKKGTATPLTERQKSQMNTEGMYRKAMANQGIANPPPLPPPVYYPNYRPLFLDYSAVAREAVVRAPPAPVPPGVYEFLPDTRRPVELRRRYGHRDYWYIGTLDAAGTFEFDGNYLHCTGPKPAGAPEAVLLNREDLGPCYEYRSGRLIKGRIDDKLNFVPDVGSKVIDFKDYHYGPGALPIWNLPGSFKKKEPDKK